MLDKALALHVKAFRVANRILKRPCLSEEVVQDVLAQIINYRGEPVKDFTGWYLTCIRHRALNVRRGELKYDLMEATPEETYVPRVVMQQELQSLQKAVQELPAVRRQMVELHYLKEMTGTEIAVLTGRNAETVKANYRNGFKDLQKIFKEVIYEN